MKLRHDIGSCCRLVYGIIVSERCRGRCDYGLRCPGASFQMAYARVISTLPLNKYCFQRCELDFEVGGKSTKIFVKVV